ncbi:MAG: 4,5-DOPA dioxygenase extradiol [Bacteroidetes bacterium]|nr:4,5-DOPA dioxygenase extradiol [Bacteroidota bacterium]
MSDLSKFNRFTSELKENGYLMPVFFIGHGSPMNGIEDNEFSRRWKELAHEIAQPKAVLVISAHWLSKGTKVTAMEFPPTIHDFGGFPQALFDVQYPALGSRQVASETISLLHKVHAEADHDWGLDHGAWTVVRHMYPNANIPVLQLSIDYSKGPQYHYDLAKDLYALRKKGVLILGSGNMVHNLRMVAWDRLNEPDYGFDWAYELNEKFKKLIADGNHQALINFNTISPDIKLAIPTSEHYLPLLYNLGLQRANETVSFFNHRAVGGSLTMTSLRIG